MCIFTKGQSIIGKKKSAYIFGLFCQRKSLLYSYSTLSLSYVYFLENYTTKKNFTIQKPLYTSISTMNLKMGQILATIWSPVPVGLNSILSDCSNITILLYLSVYFCKNNNLLCVYLLKANQLSVKKKVGIHFWFITLKSANVFCFGLLAAKSLLKTMRSFLRGLIILKNEINEKLNSRLELDLSSFLKLYSLIL